MNEHEKEKRGKVAELMYELLDFGRMEQLARDIWDKAPEDVKREVATLFANRVKAELTRQQEWSPEPKKDNCGNAVPQPKPAMQLAFEKVASEAIEKYMAEHAESIRATLYESAKAKLEERLTKESSFILDTVFQKLRKSINEGFGSRW